jgi:hypothetical protein
LEEEEEEKTTMMMMIKEKERGNRSSTTACCKHRVAEMFSPNPSLDHLVARTFFITPFH